MLHAQFTFPASTPNKKDNSSYENAISRSDVLLKYTVHILAQFLVHININVKKSELPKFFVFFL